MSSRHSIRSQTISLSSRGTKKSSPGPILSRSGPNPKLHSKKTISSTLKAFDEESYAIKEELRRIYGGQCYEILKIQENEIAILRERLRNAGLDDRVTSSELQMHTIFQLTTDADSTMTDFHSKFHLLCLKYKISPTIENQITTFHDVNPVCKKYKLNSNFKSEVTLLFSEYLQAQDPFQQDPDNFATSIAENESQLQNEEDMEPENEGQTENEKHPETEKQTEKEQNEQQMDGAIEEEEETTEIFDRDIVLDEDYENDDNGTRTGNLQNAHSLKMVSKSPSQKSENSESSRLFSKNFNFEQIQGDEDIKEAAFHRVCDKHDIPNEVRSEIWNVFVWDESEEIHDIIPSSLKTEIYRLFKTYHSSVAIEERHAFEKELAEILDNPAYTCRDYKLREELTAELNELKKQLTERILVPKTVQKQIRQLISQYATDFHDEDRFDLALAELLATPDIRVEDPYSVLAEELTKGQMRQMLRHFKEENEVYQEKLEMINSQLQEATNHPLFENIEQARQNISSFNDECSKLEQLLSNVQSD